MVKKILFFLLMGLSALPLKTTAQELLPPPDQPTDNKDETETKPATVEENSDSKNEDTELFGEDNPKPEEEKENTPTHKLIFNFVGRAQFIDLKKNPAGELLSPEPYMQVEYDVHFEAPLVLDERKISTSVDATYDTNTIGALAQNEFFECKLDIDMQETPVELTVKKNVKTDEEGKPLEQSLAIKVGFSKDTREDWFSLCHDVTGANLNTQGEPEEYMLRILKNIQPSLSGMIIENFNPSEKQKINLEVESKPINDIDMNNDIILSGEGTVTVDPID